jgi:hypothetical protein
VVLICLCIAFCAPGRAAKSQGQAGNPFYQGNRAPLTPSPFIKLPIGSIRPQGWLRKQLALMADGFSGRLPEVSPWATYKGNAWVSATGTGEHGWEEVPYWLRGYGDLGYVLGDARITADMRRWIEGILSSQRPDGYFGPEANRTSVDLWPNMLALFALRSFYEATGDKRVLPFMSRYFRWQSRLPLYKYLPDSWQKCRGGDNLDSIYWLYNRTGEKWLLDHARVTHERTLDWVGGIASLHGVNFAQSFREPGQFYQQTHDARYVQASRHDLDLMVDTYGQVPGGLYGADENARQGYVGPRQAAETCAMVEMMYSDELLLRITGDASWADRCEDVAFNSLPASMTPDLKGLHYLTAPNQIQLDRQDKSPAVQNGGDMFSYNPKDYRCCQHNTAFGWPYFAEHLWMATPGAGLAATLYAPSMVNARVGKGTSVRIEEITDYPFDGRVALHVSTPAAVRFPLTLRVPGWCSRPRVSVNGERVAGAAKHGWLTIDRTWSWGDTVKLDLPMPVTVKTWERNRRAVSVYRGPLGFSLKIGESWKRYGDDPWPGYEVFPTSPWNYGLALDSSNPAGVFTVVRRAGPMAEQPFTPDAAPVALKVKAKRIPQWTQQSNGMIAELQPSPIRSEEPVEEVTLIPMGCARLRVSAFPTIGEGPDAHPWPELVTVAEASHVNDSDTVSALNDGLEPKSSADGSKARFTWWDHLGTHEWVEYQFSKPRSISRCEVYWYDDTPSGGGCRVPASWHLLYWDGSAWQPVSGATAYGNEKDRFNRVDFTPVTTTRLRLDVQLQSGASGGILAWRTGT